MIRITGAALETSTRNTFSATNPNIIKEDRAKSASRFVFAHNKIDRPKKPQSIEIKKGFTSELNPIEGENFSTNR